MKYKEYLSSARKHYLSCVAIKDALDRLDESDSTNMDKIRSLTLNLYYISGYMIECSIKYGIYVYAEYDENANVKHINTDEIKYNQHIKHHRFDRYADILISKNSEIPLVGNNPSINKEVKSLYNNWDVDIRYCVEEIPAHNTKCICKIHVVNFFEYATSIFTKIQHSLR